MTGGTVHSRRLLNLGGLLLAAAASLSAGPYFSENFDIFTAAQQKLYTGPVPVGTNFLLTSGSVDVVGPAYFPGLCLGPAIGVCVDLRGESPGTLVSTPFNLPQGSFYLDFVLNGTGLMRPLNGDDMASARVTMASPTATFFDQVFTLPSAYTGTVHITISVANAAQGQGTTITFASSNPPHVSAAQDPNAPKTGLMVDNVSVTDALDASLPEPSTLFGGILALPLLWMARRRIRQ
jgi:hypothetical protein